MMRRVCMMAGLVLLAALGWGCDRGNKPRPEVSRVVDDLGSKDELKVRSAVQALGNMGNSQCITSAVGPLTAVLKDPNHSHDIYTRSLVPEALANISRSCKDEGQALAVLNPLFDAVFHAQSDLLRAKTALALGDSKRPQAEALLKAAAVTDDSIMVREAAKTALHALMGKAAGGGGQGKGKPGDRSDPNASPALSAASISAPVMIGAVGDSVTDERCISPEMDEWIKRHIIVLDHNLKRPPVCAR